MGKREFLEVLGEKLLEELPRSMVTNHLQYYENYINSEIAKGRASSEVMEELGNPILIAHTIINTETGESYQGYVEDADFVEIEEASEENDKGFTEKNVEYEYAQVHTEDEQEPYGNVYKSSKDALDKKQKMGCMISAVAVVLVVLVILSLLGGLISLLLPIILPIVIIGFVLSFFSGKK